MTVGDKQPIGATFGSPLFYVRSGRSGRGSGRGSGLGWAGLRWAGVAWVGPAAWPRQRKTPAGLLQPGRGHQVHQVAGGAIASTTGAVISNDETARIILGLRAFGI